MPFNTLYDVETCLIRLVGEGAVSMEDRRQSVRQILSNSEYSNQSNILVDVSRVTNSPVGTEFIDVSNLIRLLRSRFSGRIGIVNTTAGHVTVSQLVALSTDMSRDYVRVFFSEEEAFEWFNHSL